MTFVGEKNQLRRNKLNAGDFLAAKILQVSKYAQIFQFRPRSLRKE